MSGIRGRLARIDDVARGVDRFATKIVTFTGASGLGQAGTNVPIFTVTGEVLIVALSPSCTTTLTQAAGTATVSLGTTGRTALFIPATNSIAIGAGEFWILAGGVGDAHNSGAALGSTQMNVVVTDDIIVACATQDTNGGVLRFDVFWRPLSENGNLVPA